MSEPPFEWQGLSESEAARRLIDEGPNALPAQGRRRWGRILLDAGRDPMFSLLLFAAGLYLLLGEPREGYSLLLLVCLAMGLTLYQEGKAEYAIQALRDLSSPRARVIRDGVTLHVPGAAVVREDLLVLAEGDRIAADAILLSPTVLSVDESLLTGESVAVDKAAGSSLHSGALVIRGQGMARVVATGTRSQMGRIGVALQAVHVEASPLRIQTDQLVRRLAWLGFGLSLFLVLLQGLQHGDWLQALLAGIALAISLLPQEFTVVLAVLPALGAWRLARQQVLTRRISAIETLGAVSVLCVDKTGTLTANHMRVARLEVEEQSLELEGEARTDLPEHWHTLVEFAILASMPDPFDPMEQAFHGLGQQFLSQTEHLHRDWALVREYPLTPELRSMAHVWKAVDGDTCVVAAKGAPEAIVDLCHLDARERDRIDAAVQRMATDGLRVLAVGRARFFGTSMPPEQHDFPFEFVGLLGLVDPLRDEIPQAVRECQEAGIRIVMITGDYPATAQAIAGQAGLTGHEVITGDELDRLDDDDLRRRMHSVAICARISPVQKLRIVQALQQEGKVVAMTGDGVNDAPALKAAHVGVAMGGRGTDVAREAADIVLVDDHFASIVAAVRQGRRIFDNLRKSMAYILAVHVPIAGMALLPLLLGWPVILYPLHIALLEMAIDPACAMVFESEPAEDDTMQRQPRNPQTPLVSVAVMWQSLAQGAGVLGLVSLVYALGLQSVPASEARAAVFSLLVLSNLVLVWVNRSNWQHAGSWLSLPTRMQLLVGALVLAMLLVSLLVSPFSQALGFGSLSSYSLWLVLAGAAGSLLWCIGFRAAVRRWR